MSDENTVTRREMLARTGRLAAGVGLGLAMGDSLLSSIRPANAQEARRVIGANDRIVMGLIGSGGMGRGDMDGLMKHANVDIAAVCDVDTSHMAEAAQMVQSHSGRRPAEVKDFRDLLAMKDIDAVIIATPDHWHALPFVLACEAGKDIFCEKPISHNIFEGRQMVNAARKYNRVVQINTWQRSTQHFVDAIDYVRSGKLGKISVVRAWRTDNARTGHQDPKDPPKELDYDFWVGPAAMEPYRENHSHFQWRWFWNYGGGMTCDWGVHMVDIALLGMSQNNVLPLPTRIAAVGGKLAAPADDRTTPDTHMAIYEFPGFVMQWETHAGDYGMDNGGDHGAEWLGSEGRVWVNRNGWMAFDKDGKELPKPSSARKVDDHQGDFLNAMRTRGVTRSDIASMHQTTTVCHLANLAYVAGHALDWDPVKEVVTNDRRAMDLLPYRRPYRRPWKLPVYTI